MIKIVRNAIIAAVAVSAFTGSAFAQQNLTSCANHDTYWGVCLGAANNGHDGSRGHDLR